MIHGHWIGGGNLLRTEFDLAWLPEFAEVKICGLGWHELYINGRRVGDEYFVPAQTDYEKRVFFLRHEVTEFLRPGRNAIGIRLGNGFFGQDKVLDRYGWAPRPYGAIRANFELLARSAEQSIFTVASDDHWLAADGPTIEDNVYWGEVYDARLYRADWALPGADLAGWRPACFMTVPTASSCEQPLEPERVIRRLPPVTVVTAPDGSWIYDFGENIAGVAELTVEAAAGSVVVLEFAEELDEHGVFDPASTGVFATGQTATDRYICAGGGVECWRPSFVYHGFRYCRVSGTPVQSLTACEIHTDVAHTGRFHSSDALANQIYDMCRRTLLGNLHSLPTDCPAREKCGWLGDAQVEAEFAIYNFNCHKLLVKYIDDIVTSAQHGIPPMVAPGSRKCGAATPGWGTALVQLPWYVYLYYADAAPMRRHYTMMKKWLAHLTGQAENHIVRYGLGDWCPPGTVNPTATPVALTSTAYYYLDAYLLAKMAHIMGYTADAEYFTGLARQIRDAFQQEFFDAKRHSFGSQSADAIALAYDLAPEGEAQAVAAALERDLCAHDYHFTTGISGLKHLFSQLSRYGYEESAWRSLTVSGYPGFAELIRQGATTLWETWEKNPADEATPRSRNHPMQTGWASWLSAGIGGFNPDWERPGWEHIRFTPCFVPQLEHAEAELQTPRGLLRSSWNRRADGVIDWRIAVPKMSKFTVELPAHWRVKETISPHHFLLERI